jgi:hypothetical protein
MTDDDDNILYVGVSGYFDQKFDEEEATELLEDALDDIEKEYIDTGEFDEIAIVSGLTDHGMPKIAYQVANFRGYETVGVAPKAVNETGYELYPVDEIIYEGENFGDEIDKYIEMIDVFVRIGGGSQTQKELELAEEEDISVIEYDLESFEE